jgi:hypothetical protein
VSRNHLKITTAFDFGIEGDKVNIGLKKSSTAYRTRIERGKERAGGIYYRPPEVRNPPEVRTVTV